jgi:ubiquinone/menaquinone biosynthesis C-methylase UbiE
LTESISFDRAAAYYDRTRAFPDNVMARLVPMLVAELPPDKPCLEIGIGTGRIALPLMSRGVRIVGIDLSLEMLRKLLDKARRSAPPLAIADATRLPFASRTFGSAIAAHVLHLIPNWRSAVDELTRVVRPGGVLVASRGGVTRAEWQRAVRRRFFSEAGDPPWPPGIDRIEELDEEMRARGADLRELPELRSEMSASINDLLAALEAGIWSSCWTIDEHARMRAAAATRDWARRALGDLDMRRAASYGSTWHAYALAQ